MSEKKNVFSKLQAKIKDGCGYNVWECFELMDYVKVSVGDVDDDI